MLRALLFLALLCGLTRAVFISQYYPEYNAQYLPPSQIPFSKLSHLLYFVSAPQKDGSLTPLNASVAPEVLAGAKAARVPVILTVGGWTGSQYFSTLVGTETMRKTFIASIQRIIKQYGMAGVQIDWESPGVQTIGCNAVSSSDTSNLLLFLKELRAALGISQSISLAVGTGLFADTSSMSAFAPLLDFVMLMAYDIGGPWLSSTSPNAPLQVCAPNLVDVSVTTAIKTWIKGGVTANKIVLGLPAYGYGYKGVASLKQQNVDGMATTVYQTYSMPYGGATADAAGKDICGNVQQNGGQWLFKELIENGKLDKTGLVGAGGYNRYWDICTSTPYIWSQSDQLLIAYDDSMSIANKTALAKKMGLQGFAFFDSTGDAGTMLLDAATSAFLPSGAITPISAIAEIAALPHKSKKGTSKTEKTKSKEQHHLTEHHLRQPLLPKLKSAL